MSVLCGLAPVVLFVTCKAALAARSLNKRQLRNDDLVDRPTASCYDVYNMQLNLDPEFSGAEELLTYESSYPAVPAG